jgi:hypothetical protein
MSNDAKAELAAELTRLLEAWGGEPGRWPEHIRGRIERLAQTHHDGRRLIAEARALDRVLDRARDASAHLSPAARRMLADRIVAAAMASAPAGPARTAEVIRLPSRARPQVQPSAVVGRRWPAASLMAASLLAGLYLGGSINLAPMFQELADAAGLSTVVDTSAVALGDDLTDEDTP